MPLSKFQHLIFGLSNTRHTQEAYQSDLQVLKIQLVHTSLVSEFFVMAGNGHFVLSYLLQWANRRDTLE